MAERRRRRGGVSGAEEVGRAEEVAGRTTESRSRVGRGLLHEGGAPEPRRGGALREEAAGSRVGG